LDSQLDQTQIIKNLSADSEKFTHAGKMVKSVSLWRSRSAKEKEILWGFLRVSAAANRYSEAS
jgi:hypothetical protein